MLTKRPESLSFRESHAIRCGRTEPAESLSLATEQLTP
jgi:hypothetical protein